MMLRLAIAGTALAAFTIPAAAGICDVVPAFCPKPAKLERAVRHVHRKPVRLMSRKSTVKAVKKIDIPTRKETIIAHVVQDAPLLPANIRSIAFDGEPRVVWPPVPATPETRARLPPVRTQETWLHTPAGKHITLSMWSLIFMTLAVFTLRGIDTRNLQES